MLKFLKTNRLSIYKPILLIAIFSFVSISIAAPPKFDRNSAFTFLYKQVAFGPRIPGTESHQRAIDSYVSWFEECGLSVRIQQFNADIHTLPDINSPTNRVTGKNVIARYGTAATPDFIFCAHFDTRPWCDMDPDTSYFNTPCPGANDGASGVAVLLEIARLFVENPPDVTIEFVLFDVEDSGVPANNETYCIGSAHYARNYAGRAPFGAILLDMIGDSDLQISKENFSWTYSRDWTDHLFSLAKEENLKSFVDEVGTAVFDDHVNLLRAGIPTCNLIDFDYEYWHTHMDVPEACSSESLEEVGNLLVRLIWNE
jgi:Peptidase family M28